MKLSATELATDLPPVVFPQFGKSEFQSSTSMTHSSGITGGMFQWRRSPAGSGIPQLRAAVNGADIPRHAHFNYS